MNVNADIRKPITVNNARLRMNKYLLYAGLYEIISIEGTIIISRNAIPEY